MNTNDDSTIVENGSKKCNKQNFSRKREKENGTVFFFFFFFFYIQQIKDTTHNKSKRKILTHGQTRTLNQTIQNNRYQPRTPQGTMRYRQSPGPTKNKPTIN